MRELFSKELFRISIVIFTAIFISGCDLNTFRSESGPFIYLVMTAALSILLSFALTYSQRKQQLSNWDHESVREPNLGMGTWLGIFIAIFIAAVLLVFGIGGIEQKQLLQSIAFAFIGSFLAWPSYWLAVKKCNEDFQKKINFITERK
jgi:hypothetical protein